MAVKSNSTHVDVSGQSGRDRKLGEKELSGSEKYCWMLAEAARDMIFVVNANGYVQYVNRYAAKQFDSEPKEVIGKTLQDLFPSDVYARQQESLKKVIETGEPMQFETQVSFKGRKVWLATSLVVAGKKAGEVTSVMGISRDISEQKRVETELREERDRARKYLEIAGVIIISITPDERVSLINKKGCEILGYAEGEIIGKNWFEHFIPERVREEVRSVFRRQMAGEIASVERFENPVLTGSGEERIIAWKNAALRDENGAIVSTLSSGEDITVRARADEGLRNLVTFENLVTTISKDFINADLGRIDREIGGALKKIGEFSQADRSYVFLLSGDGKKADNTHEWCRDGITPQIDNLKGLPVDRFPWFLEKMQKHEVILVPRVTDLPPEACAEKELFVRQDIRSIICVPMVSNDVLIGFLGLDSVRTETVWSEECVSLLKVVGDIFANTLERELAEEVLRESEERYRAIVEDQTDLICRWGPGFVLTYVNDIYCRFFGKTREELIGTNFLSLIPLKDHASVRERFAVLTRDNPIVTHVHRVIDADGKVRWQQWVNRALFDAEGALVECQAVGRDITEVKRIEERLKRMNDCFLSLGADPIENIGRLTAVCGELLGASCALYNRLEGGMVRSWGRWNAPPDLEKEFVPEGRICADVIRDGRDETVVVHNLCETGYGKTDPNVTRYGLCTYVGRVVKFGGTAIGCLCALYKDDFEPREDDMALMGAIASAISVEERRRENEESIRRGERFLSGIFESIQDGLCILDNDLNVVRVNATMEKWYAHSVPLVGKKCFEVFHGIKETCEGCPAVRTLETGKASYAVVPRMGPRKNITGWIDLFTYPFIDPATGKMQGVIEYVRDITEKKRAVEGLERANSELIKSNLCMKQLALKDPQTDLYNHRYLMDVIEAEFDRAKRYVHPLSVIMMDVDYFKSINDVYGHQFGDLVLKQLARQLKRMVRRYDVVVRFGGEEFVIVSPGIDRTKALLLARRILDAVKLYNFGNRKHTVKLKLSLAVASYPEDKTLKGMDLIKLTDEILNKVKEFGGDKVYCSSDIGKGAASHEAEEHPDTRLLTQKLDRLTKRANESLIEAIFAFAKTIEVKDYYTGQHVERTVHYATEIAKEFHLLPESVEHIRQAAMLHDLGKVGISEKILLKKSTLTRKEFEEISRHPQIGVDIIRPIHFLHDIIPLILYHHERWDGKGYPQGLKGEEIPIGARIITVADVYQALISHRSYRRAYSKRDAISMLKKGSGTHFDPNIVDVFLRILGREKKSRG